MILVVGARGMLGRELLGMLEGTARGLTHDEMEITSVESVRKALLTIKPAVVINTIAYTDVDGCESNSELAFRVNGEGVRNLAEASAEIGAKLVHISTDYVFDGEKETPYLEDDTPRPINVYGQSKLQGEQHVSELLEHYWIVRTS